MFDAANPDTDSSGQTRISAGIDVSNGERPILHANAEGLVRRRVGDTVAVAHMKPEIIEVVLARELGLVRDEHERGDLDVPQAENQTTEEALKDYLLNMFDDETRTAYLALVRAHSKDQEIIQGLLELASHDPEKYEEAMRLVRERISIGTSIDILNSRVDQLDAKKTVKPITPMGMVAVKTVQVLTGVFKMGKSSKNPTGK